MLYIYILNTFYSNCSDFLLFYHKVWFQYQNKCGI